jgi:hypothetical protein
MKTKRMSRVRAPRSTLPMLLYCFKGLCDQLLQCAHLGLCLKRAKEVDPKSADAATHRRPNRYLAC